MAYNQFYTNPYGYGGYPYGNIQTQPLYQQPQITPQQAQQPQQPQQQTYYLPLTFTSGLVGAKAFIVAPNQTVYLKDSDDNSNLLFEKSADYNGKYTLKAYRMTEINIEDIGKKVEEQKSDKPEYATKQDLNDLKSFFENGIVGLSNLIQTSLKPMKNNYPNKEGRKNE